MTNKSDDFVTLSKFEVSSEVRSKIALSRTGWESDFEIAQLSYSIL
ncbi:hypothetical protein CKA32_004478 [Geitlerinema sp. FC II]|nr:hypothetical protein CKA32_004478 [Geitlerinema sp. FC II]